MRFRTSGLACLLLLAASACGAPQKAAPLGAAELTSPLYGPDGATSLQALAKDHRATVLVFWSAGCPCVRRYQARIDALVERWTPQDVQVVGIDANADETLRDVEVARRERHVQLPIYRDRGGLLAKAVGARSTPTVAVVLPDGQIAYRGWIDNERDVGQPGRQPWLDNALQRVLAGNVQPEERPRWGCLITGGEPADGAAPASDCGCKTSHAK